ncbi:MAG: bifunctional proline dehydrogenase/L-glutamate gamma-semialdehyde dehydrogenase [Pirellulales bacterium]
MSQDEWKLGEFHPDPQSPLPVEVQHAVALARQLQQRAGELQTPQERRQQAELDRMIHNPGDKATLVEMTDQAFRSRVAGRAADQLIYILDVQGVPRFFSPLERTLLMGFQSFGAYLPGVAMPLVRDKMQHETANVILPAERELLREHLEARREEGVRMNVNFLGEALLGEGDARRRLESYLTALQRPEIEVISVKISTIYSQISPLARRHTIEVLCDRLELLFRAALRGRFTRQDGTVVPKFVYLDMEEYRDKELTAEAFMQALDRPGLEQARAGLVLQAYIPDAYATQERFTEWAKRRLERGGAPLTLRIVKGANMEAERVEASLRGWPQAPFKTKLETDANYLRMLHYGMQPENIAAVRLGIASHNLFTLAYGLALAVQSGVAGVESASPQLEPAGGFAALRPQPPGLELVQFEMLEGMANHQRRALFELVQNLLLYAPACKQEEFVYAIGYLVRRLDENTGPDNFLRHAFNITVDSPQWQKLEQQFVDSFTAIPTLSAEPRRTQDRKEGFRIADRGLRIEEPSVNPQSAIHNSQFHNEPDTDWALPQHSQWADEIVRKWQPLRGEQALDVPLVIAGEEIGDCRHVRDAIDPSRPGVIVGRYRQAIGDDIDRAVKCAQADPCGWRRMSPAERTSVLNRVAEQLSAARADLLGVMIADGGKLLTESDSEVSEAIDFCRFYAQSAQELHELPGLKARGKGVVVVVSPWNFPLAIPCGGIAAALAAGNTVILKPASDTVLIAYRLCECFWNAGVPKEALQFVPCSGATEGERLVSHDGVDAVILTGGTATALEMLRHKPTLPLFAETGGKNATIVTALADRDLAIKNVLHSAFSHSGQKCSATSLLILEDEVYHDKTFRETLVDAVESLRIGSAWELSTKLGPLIRPPRDELERGLKELEPGESWAVMPRLHVDGNPGLVGPGVKWDVAAGNFTHCTELFGPVLGVLRASNLHEAIDLVNATGYGLTSGLESLDHREHEIWQQRIRAGNLYINRPTTGAIVLRQPFGGMGKSVVGPGLKAGGPNYVVPLMAFEGEPTGKEARLPGDPLLAELTTAVEMSDAPTHERERVIAAIQSYDHWARLEFLQSHDHFRLLGEDNLRRYLPYGRVRVRVHADDKRFDIFARAAAARAVGARVVISTPPDCAGDAAVEALDRLTDPWAGAIEFVEETDDALADFIRMGDTDRLRYASPERVPNSIRRVAAEVGYYVADSPVSAHGRVELVWYVQEQSFTRVYHRYGNLGARGAELRAEPL